MSLSDAVILVVEDSPLILMSALELVKSAGFEGVGAESADEAIGILEARADIRLVFTDVEMPGTMDGVKLAQYIRDRWPPIHLIVASGRSILEESQLPSDCVEEVVCVASGGSEARERRREALCLRRALAAAPGSTWRACGGSERWLRGGTRHVHRRDLVVAAGRGAECA